MRLDGAVSCVYRKEGAELRPSVIPPRPARLAVEDYYVECVTHPCSLIRVGGRTTWEKPTALPLLAPTLRSIEGQREKLVEIDAQCAVGQYIAMISLSDSGAELLLEDCGDSVLCHGNEVTVKRRYLDLRGRSVTTRHLWQGTRFESSREIAYSRETSFRPEEMGRELLEGVIAEDPSFTELLSPDMADAKMICDYFGNVTEVTSPLSPTSPTAVTAIIKKANALVASTYDFDFDEKGRIENIRCLDE